MAEYLLQTHESYLALRIAMQWPSQGKQGSGNAGRVLYTVDPKGMNTFLSVIASQTQLGGEEPWVINPSRNMTKRLAKVLAERREKGNEDG